MFFKKTALRIVLIFALAATLVGVYTKQAAAHGTMSNPPGRVYVCYLEGPEHPVSAACQAAVAAGGTQALYDWNGIRQGNANGQHQALIPDGKLCSANGAEFVGMDLVRSDWPATTLPTSGNYTWSFRVTAQHMGNMYLYVTKNGYDPNQPLKWSDLESTPFTSYATNTTAGSSGNYTWTSAVPSGKSGRHIIYMIWQRTDSMEAFYSCSDVIFGSGGNPTATPQGPAATFTRTPTIGASPTRTNTPVGPTATITRTPTVGASPTRTNTPAGPTATFTRTPTQSGVAAWAPNTAYAVNAQVTYGGHTYKCLQAHTSLTGWEPPNVPALWQLIS